MIWLNDGLRDAATMGISPSDRGFLLGDGLFETIRVAHGRPCHVSAHLARLAEGATLLAIRLPFAQSWILTAIDAVIAANGLTEGSLRLTVSRGCGPRGVLPPPSTNPTVMITAADGGAADTAASVIVATVTRRNEWSPLSRVKSLNYLDSILARNEASGQGADEAILLNTRGMVAEASCANLLVLKGTSLHTPPIKDGALPGVIRSCLLARSMVREMSVAPVALFEADALFLCSALGIRAVDRIDGRPIPVCTAMLADLRIGAGFSVHR